jgi:hypothetical protein
MEFNYLVSLEVTGLFVRASLSLFSEDNPFPTFYHTPLGRDPMDNEE